MLQRVIDVLLWLLLSVVVLMLLLRAEVVVGSCYCCAVSGGLPLQVVVTRIETRHQ